MGFCALAPSDTGTKEHFGGLRIKARKRFSEDPSLAHKPSHRPATEVLGPQFPIGQQKGGDLFKVPL